MKVSYGEGLAIRTGSESCIGIRKGAGEALTGVRIGQVLSREIETHRGSGGYCGVPTLSKYAEGKTGGVDIARCFWTPRGLRPYACT
jgi:hypothetical protein